MVTKSLRTACGFGNVSTPNPPELQEDDLEKTVQKREKGNRLFFRLLLFALPHLVTAYSRLIELTCRKIFIHREVEEQICRRMPFTCACFHGTMLYPVYYCRRYPGVIMVSRSWDGELIDRCLRKWGYDTVRGSSSRGGKEALQELIEKVNQNQYCSGLAVDAPRGPARKVKIGIVLTARDTGTPIVPMVSWATSQIQFKSWDRMIVPLPFSTIAIAFGSPTHVPKDLEKDEYEALRQNVEQDMTEASARAELLIAQLKERGRSIDSSPNNHPMAPGPDGDFARQNQEAS